MEINIKYGLKMLIKPLMTLGMLLKLSLLALITNSMHCSMLLLQKCGFGKMTHTK